MSRQRAIDIIYIYIIWGNYPAIFILFFLKRIDIDRVIFFESTVENHSFFDFDSKKIKC